MQTHMMKPARAVPPPRPAPALDAAEPVSHANLQPLLASAYDPALLVMALEEIESRRAALERLLEEDLLHCCLA